MANRHLSRSIALQSLFEWDFNSNPTVDGKKVVAPPVEEVAERNVAEFAPGLDDLSFITKLLSGVSQERKKLDDIIEKAAPDWPIDKIAIVDRNVLRIGLYELLFADRSEVPARVALNEAIELAKTFGGENSGKFVNGVLGTVYKELGEPGKDDIPAKKRRANDVRYEDMPIELLAGAVVYTRRDDGSIELALVHDIFGYWTLSKGHVEEGEDKETAAAREIKEEISLDLDIKEPLSSNEYVASDPKRGKIRKNVSYFLGEARDASKLALTKHEGLDDARWFKLDEILNLKMYDDILPIVTAAINLLQK